MAMASTSPCEEQLLCSICLDVFTEPVSTPCGHNYCKSCITRYWTSSGRTQCPLCKETFCKQPQLQVNTGFRDMVEHFKNMTASVGDELLAKRGEVTCDICIGPKLKAQKTCLVCLASYCQPHLEPHQRVTTLKKHTLIDPVANLEDRVCKRHDKMMELFCQMDQTCVCLLCLKDGHEMHGAIPLEQAFREGRTQLQQAVASIKTTEKVKSKIVKQVQYSVKQSKKESGKELADIDEIFTSLVASLQRRQAELTELFQEKQKAAEKRSEDHVAQLQQEVNELRRRREEMEKLLQTDDHISFLQSWPSFTGACAAAHTEDALSPLSAGQFPQDFSNFSHQSEKVRMVKTTVAQMEKTLINEMEMLIEGIKLCDTFGAADALGALETDLFFGEVWNLPQDKLRMFQQCDSVDVILDPSTANSRLMVSKDGKRLSVQKGREVAPARGFVFQPFVLGKAGFSSGRFYYEVRVSGSTSWVLGVAAQSLCREVINAPCPEDGGWTITGITNQHEQHYFANQTQSTPLYLRQRPQTVGVFVDYEVGEVSFYDAGARTLIYSFTDCIFNDTTPAFKALIFSLAGTTVRPKLYPLFGMYGDDGYESLVITPVGSAA